MNLVCRSEHISEMLGGAELSETSSIIMEESLKNSIDIGK